MAQAAVEARLAHKNAEIARLESSVAALEPYRESNAALKAEVKLLAEQHRLYRVEAEHKVDSLKRRVKDLERSAARQAGALAAASSSAGSAPVVGRLEARSDALERDAERLDKARDSLQAELRAAVKTVQLHQREAQRREREHERVVEELRGELRCKSNTVSDLRAQAAALREQINRLEGALQERETSVREQVSEIRALEQERMDNAQRIGVLQARLEHLNGGNDNQHKIQHLENINSLLERRIEEMSKRVGQTTWAESKDQLVTRELQQMGAALERVAAGDSDPAEEDILAEAAAARVSPLLDAEFNALRQRMAAALASVKRRIPPPQPPRTIVEVDESMLRTHLVNIFDAAHSLYEANVAAGVARQPPARSSAMAMLFSGTPAPQLPWVTVYKALCEQIVLASKREDRSASPLRVVKPRSPIIVRSPPRSVPQQQQQPEEVFARHDDDDDWSLDSDERQVLESPIRVGGSFRTRLAEKWASSR